MGYVWKFATGVAFETAVSFADKSGHPVRRASWITLTRRLVVATRHGHANPFFECALLGRHFLQLRRICAAVPWRKVNFTP